MQIGPKETIFKRVLPTFFQSYWMATQVIIILIDFSNFSGNTPKKVKWVWSLEQISGQIRSMLRKNKETGISIGFFHILHVVKERSSGYRNTS